MRVFPIFLMACDPMPTPGAPLQQVSLKTEAAVETVPLEKTEAVETPSEEFVLTSDDFKQELDKQIEEDGLNKEETPEAAVAVKTDPEKPVSAVPAITTPIPTAPLPTAPIPTAPLSSTAQTELDASKAETSALSAWPIRVVQTLPNLNPPRAVVGLPDGSEVVVTAGQMLPEHNLVVISIGTKLVDFVRISSLGDHAKVEALSILPQN